MGSDLRKGSNQPRTTSGSEFVESAVDNLLGQEKWEVLKVVEKNRKELWAKNLTYCASDAISMVHLEINVPIRTSPTRSPTMIDTS